MTQEELKRIYGWSKELEEFFISSDPTLSNEYKGSFKIKNLKGRMFWYYQLSRRGSGREKYICSVEITKDAKSSFSACCKILKEKVGSNFVITSNNQKFLHPYIDLYQQYLSTEGEVSKGGRRDNTTSRLSLNINDFKTFCMGKDVRLHIVPSEGLKDLFLEYIKYLKEREKKGSRGTLQRGTIKTYIQGVRYFFDWICKDKRLGGLQLFPSHPLTVELQNELLIQEVGYSIRKEGVVRFKMEYYEEGYKVLLDRVRDIWIAYCKNGQINRLVDKNGKVNQPQVLMGQDLIYFTSLLQLRGGFRIGEVLYSYRNVSIYNEYHLVKYPKEMGSYWSFDEVEGWLLNIRNSKGKNRTIPVNDTIWSWDEPPKGVQSKFIEDSNKGHWETYLVDIMMELFPSSYYLFPSPNHIDNPNSPRSKTYVMNIFKDVIVQKEGFNRFGIESSHNLRSFFISYLIRREDITPLQVCEITGHNLSTMERYYLRENLQSKFNTYKKVDQRNLLR